MTHHHLPSIVYTFTLISVEGIHAATFVTRVYSGCETRMATAQHLRERRWLQTITTAHSHC